MKTVEILFWTSFAILIYVYFGYFILLFLITRFIRKKDAISYSDSYKPVVSILIAAYNEEAVIREKIKNSLAQDYPSDKLEIIVGSDDSVDKTNEIVKEFADRGVQLRVVSPRKGKTNVLNNLVPYATGEILIFTDANAFFKKDAVSCLVRPFFDKAIGCVCGRVLPKGVDPGAMEYSSGLYWKMEEKMKRYESMLGSSMGATGAIFALRKKLYEQYPITMVPDFVPSLNVIAKGYRIMNIDDAIAFEKMATTDADEFKRKRRIAARSLLGLVYLRTLLNPFKFPVTAFQIISHKILRWMSLPFIITVFISNLLLAYAYKGPWLIFILCQTMFFLAALLGFLLKKKKSKFKLFGITYYFVLVNIAAFFGVVDFLFGRVPVVWDTAKSSRERVDEQS